MIFYSFFFNFFNPILMHLVQHEHVHKILDDVLCVRIQIYTIFSCTLIFFLFIYELLHAIIIAL